MKFLVLAFSFMSVSGFADSPSRMSDVCYQKLGTLVEDSVQASKWDIISALQYDWRLHPDLSVAKYEDCGASDYYYITVDKATCSVVESGSGDSDGECN